MRYVGTRRSETNPLRSLPFSRPAADVLHVSQRVSTVVEPVVSVWPEPSAEILQQREFASAEASLAIAVEALASARLVVEDAKRTTTAPIVVNGRPAGGGRPIAPADQGAQAVCPPTDPAPSCRDGNCSRPGRAASRRLGPSLAGRA